MIRRGERIAVACWNGEATTAEIVTHIRGDRWLIETDRGERLSVSIIDGRCVDVREPYKRGEYIVRNYFDAGDDIGDTFREAFAKKDRMCSGSDPGAAKLAREYRGKYSDADEAAMVRAAQNRAWHEKKKALDEKPVHKADHIKQVIPTFKPPTPGTIGLSVFSNYRVIR